MNNSNIYLPTSNFLTRRSFISRAIALGVMGVTGFGVYGKERIRQKNNSISLPARGNYLFQNAYIISIDPAIGDIASGDVHVENGLIKQLGTGLKVDDATLVDARGCIILPGLIDTHWHMWTALLRSMAGDKSGEGYFDVTSTYGKHYLPEDMFQATRLAANEAIFSGITTVHDWSHNVRSLNYAVNSLKALQESGLRARYSFGAASGQDGSKIMDLPSLKQLQQNWEKYSNENLISLGMAWRGIGGHPGIDSKFEIGIKELEWAREMGLPVSMHASAPGMISDLAEAGLMANDMQLVHGMGATEKEIEQMVASGASISISPFSELRIGYGIPPIPEFYEAGAIIGLSIDTTTLSGNADMFAIMKMFLNLNNALEKDEFSLTARQVLELATIEGARSLGIAEVTGSLTPGKRADLIMIDTKAPNLGLITNPVDLVVEAAQPFNVDTVMVDGRILKQQGKLTAINEELVYKESEASLEELIKRTG